MARSNYKSYCHEVKRKIRVAEMEFMAQQIKENGITPISGGKQFVVVFLKNLLPRVPFQKYVNTVSNGFNIFFVYIGKNTIQKISTLAEQF